MEWVFAAVLVLIMFCAVVSILAQLIQLALWSVLSLVNFFMKLWDSGKW